MKEITGILMFVEECMIGTGTLINSAAIVAGGALGHFTGRLFRQEQQEAVNKACGISVMFIAIAGAMQGMMSIDGGRIIAQFSVPLEGDESAEEISAKEHVLEMRHFPEVIENLLKQQ